MSVVICTFAKTCLLSVVSCIPPTLHCPATSALRRILTLSPANPPPRAAVWPFLRPWPQWTPQSATAFPRVRTSLRLPRPSPGPIPLRTRLSGPPSTSSLHFAAPPNQLPLKARARRQQTQRQQTQPQPPRRRRASRWGWRGLSQRWSPPQTSKRRRGVPPPACSQRWRPSCQQKRCKPSTWRPASRRVCSYSMLSRRVAGFRSAPFIRL